ncbi:hypothetical protein N7471_001202 [Penicillium samsonianum]|uniref:uncharacterized protein n=1 Tax=Penicillium samsonianum TaxID=1882272 RepID=UPI002547B4B8|nr:uncharacterized protein N7471_001202 [Penicillium samsonianum]KAJ6150003.1 hypothetical protein N7471_001202 [Penicillium samsonianum]
MDGVTNAAYHVGRGRSRGGNRGNDNALTNAGNDGKKKEKPLRKQPTARKDIYDYTREKRTGTQKDDSGICAFCGFGPHSTKNYAYLDKSPPDT